MGWLLAPLPCRRRDCLVHGGRRRSKRETVTDRQEGRIEGAQSARSGQGGGAMPGTHGDERKEWTRHAGNRDTSARLEGVARDQGTVPRIQKSHMTRSM